MKIKQSELEDTVMAHRYLYYVLCAPILSDHEYDQLERKARSKLPLDSTIQKVGSDLSSSYSIKQKELAEKLSK